MIPITIKTMRETTERVGSYTDPSNPRRTVRREVSMLITISPDKLAAIFAAKLGTSKGNKSRSMSGAVVAKRLKVVEYAS